MRAPRLAAGLLTLTLLSTGLSAAEEPVPDAPAWTRTVPADRPRILAALDAAEAPSIGRRAELLAELATIARPEDVDRFVAALREDPERLGPAAAAGILAVPERDAARIQLPGVRESPSAVRAALRLLAPRLYAPPTAAAARAWMREKRSTAMDVVNARFFDCGNATMRFWGDCPPALQSAVGCTAVADAAAEIRKAVLAGIDAYAGGLAETPGKPLLPGCRDPSIWTGTGCVLLGATPNDPELLRALLDAAAAGPRAGERPPSWLLAPVYGHVLTALGEHAPPGRDEVLDAILAGFANGEVVVATVALARYEHPATVSRAVKLRDPAIEQAALLARVWRRFPSTDPIPRFEAADVPLLAAYLEDPEPGVCVRAALELIRLDRAALPALPALRVARDRPGMRARQRTLIASIVERLESDDD